MEYIKITNLSIYFDTDEVEGVINSSQSFKYYSPDDNEHGLFYYRPKDELIRYVKDTLVQFSNEDYTVELCKIYKGALPHKDHDCQCKINFYLKTGGAKTIFFNDPLLTDGYSYHGDNKKHMYDIKKHRLKRSTMFVAEPGDVYLLNTSKIHAVTMDSDEPRIIVSLSFNKSFDDIKKLI